MRRVGGEGGGDEEEDRGLGSKRGKPSPFPGYTHLNCAQLLEVQSKRDSEVSV